MPHPTPATPRAFAAMLVANLVLSFGPWLVRLADVGPVAAAFWRLALALPVVAAVAWWTMRRAARPGPRAWFVLALAGLFFAADLAAWHSGILHTRLANATLFGNAAGFLFPIYGFAIARAWPGRNQRIALALAGAGVALLLGRSYELSPRNFAGDLLCLAAGVFYAGYLIAVERGRGALGAAPVLAIATLAGAPALLGSAILMGERIVPGDWTPLIALAFGSQLIGQGLMVYAIGRLPPVVIGLGLLTQPAIGAAIGWIVYGERLQPPDLVGAAAIAAALVLVRRPDRVSRPAPIS